MRQRRYYLLLLLCLTMAGGVSSSEFFQSLRLVKASLRAERRVSSYERQRDYGRMEAQSVGATNLETLKANALATWDEYNAKTVEGGDRSTYDATLATLRTQIEEATTANEVNAAVKALKPAFQIYQSSPEVTGVPLNLTDMLVNADYKQGTTGWTMKSDYSSNFTIDANYSPIVLEAYAGWQGFDLKTFSIQQEEAVMLAPGRYRLRVCALYRYGGDYNSDNGSDKSIIRATIFANETSIPVMHLSDVELSSYPDNKSSASSLFARGQYLNSLYFELTEPTSVTVGLKGKHAVILSWLVAGPFTLEKVIENETQEPYFLRWEKLKEITNQAFDHTAFDEIVAEAKTATTEEDLQTADGRVWSAFREVLQTGTTPTGQFNLTSLIETSSSSAQELYNKTSASVERVVKDLPAGTYTAKVQAFHRSRGAAAEVSQAYEQGTDMVVASLFLGGNAVTVKNINDEGRFVATRLGSDVAGAYQRSIPNTLNGADDAFAAGLYWNTLTAVLPEGDVQFGLRVENGMDGNWLPYNNFHLYYGAEVASVSLSTSETCAISDDARANVSTDIVLKAGELNKVCLPFDMTAEQVNSTFKNAYNLGGIYSDGSSLKGQLVPVSTMKAGHAYFVGVDADRALAVDDVMLHAAQPDSIPVIWEGAGTKGTYEGYTFDIFLNDDLRPLASTLTFEPIDFADVRFSTNLENWQMRHFINDNTYSESSSSVLEKYHVAPPARRDQPHAVFIPVPENHAELTLKVSEKEDLTDGLQRSYAAGTTLCEVNNLIPQRTYYYQVEANGEVLTKGQFETEGHLRMIKANTGSNIRDLGGWLNSDGNRLRYGLVYRGGEMNGGHVMNEADCNELRRLGIMAEVDLREDGDFPNGVISTSALGSDVLYTYENLNMWNEDALQQVTDKFADGFNLILRALREERATYFHCIWGADRTGCFAMLLEGLLGLPVDQMYKDYELTSFSIAGNRFKDGIDSKLNYIKALPGNNLQEQFYNYWRHGVGISKADLLEFIRRMVDGHSSIEDADLPDIIFVPVVPDGDYYLYVPEVEQFLSRGDNYGTRLITSNYGVPAHLSTNGFGNTTIQFLDSKLYLGSDVYTDKSASFNSISWTMQEHGEDAFVLQSSTGNYLKLESDGRLRLSGISSEDAVVIMVKTIDEQKQIVSAKQQQNILAAAHAAGIEVDNVDDFYTVLSQRVWQPSLVTIKSANSGNTSNWVLSEPQNTQSGWSGYNTGSYGAELYQKCGTISQTITMPHSGLYKLTLNGFYREGSNSRCYEYGQQGYDLSDAWVTVNDTYYAHIPSWYSDCVDNGNPNNTDQAKALMDAGKYGIELYAYVGTDRKAKITLHAAGYVGEGWLLFNNFALSEFAEPVTIDENASEKPEAVEVANATLLRTLVGQQWNSLCLPFALSSKQISNSPLKGAELYTFSASDATSIHLIKTTLIKSGFPYLVKPVSDVENPTFNGVSVTDTEGDTMGEAGNVQFAGRVCCLPFTEQHIRYLTTDNELEPLADPDAVKGLRAYFLTPDDASYVHLYLGDKEVGLEEIHSSQFTVHNDEAIYDLSGRQIVKSSNRKLPRGLYIKGGKLTVVQGSR